MRYYARTCAILLLLTLFLSSCGTNNLNDDSRPLPEPDNNNAGSDIVIQNDTITEEAEKDKNEEKDVFFTEPAAPPARTSIKIYKKARILELYGDGVLMGRFRIALGGSPEGDKNREGDCKTPEGSYYICTRNERSQFTLFLGISYPDIEDAQRGLDSGLIDHDVYEQIKSKIENKQLPPWDTPLGGAVGIHGGGAASDWTLGCIAVSDDDIRTIWKYAPLRTPVEISE